MNRLGHSSSQNRRAYSAPTNGFQPAKLHINLQRVLCASKKIASFILRSDVQEPEEEEEIDEYAGKRCTFFCQEIKRLQQHAAWLDGSLKAVQSKSLSRQRINAIKAVLDHGGSQTTSQVSFIILLVILWSPSIREDRDFNKFKRYELLDQQKISNTSLTNKV